jgi:hypothetical protein
MWKLLDDTIGQETSASFPIHGWWAAAVLDPDRRRPPQCLDPVLNVDVFKSNKFATILEKKKKK